MDADSLDRSVREDASGELRAELDPNTLMCGTQDASLAVLREGERTLATVFAEIERTHRVGGADRLGRFMVMLINRSQMAIDAALELVDDPRVPTAVKAHFEDKLLELFAGEVRSAVVSGELTAGIGEDRAAEYLLSTVLRMRSNRMRIGPSGFHTEQFVDLALEALRRSTPCCH